MLGARLVILGVYGFFGMAACSGTPLENRFPLSDGATSSTGDGVDGGSSGGFNVQADGGGKDESCKKMDLVFVVDNSGSMQQEQTNLIKNFPKFVELINAFKTKDGTAIDYRVAVTTTDRTVTYKVVDPFFGSTQTQNDTGNNGKFMKTTGMSRPWLERADKDVATTFSTIANVGIDGSALEMPLEASRLALDARAKDSNAGFLRTDALLGVVYMTDEDDCSRTDNNFKYDPTQTCKQFSNIPVTDYVSFFDTLKGDRSRWATAVIAGQTECKSGFGNALEAIRMKEFAKSVGTGAVFSSICEGDLTKALQDALNTFDVACKNFVPPQ